MEILDIVIVIFMLFLIVQIFIIKKRWQKINRKMKLNEINMMHDYISFSGTSNTGEEENKTHASVIQRKSPIGAIHLSNQSRESNQSNSERDSKQEKIKKLNNHVLLFQKRCCNLL